MYVTVWLEGGVVFAACLVNVLENGQVESFGQRNAPHFLDDGFVPSLHAGEDPQPAAVDARSCPSRQAHTQHTETVAG